MTPSSAHSGPGRSVRDRVTLRGRRIGERIALEARFRLLRASSDKIDLRVVGLRRSGNHAIIGWVLAQHPGRSLFLNESLPGVSPHRTRRYGWPWQRGRESGARDLLLYSYEDHSLLAVGAWNLAEREVFTGPATRRHDLLVLRDPFNMCASRLRASFETPERVRVAVNLWKSYAREFLGDQGILPQKIPVSYNAWTTDREYRAELASRIGVPFTDAGRDNVAPNGGGSSFEGRAFDGRATAMGVHDRWRALAGDPSYRELVSDPELHELSARAFGVLPGTEGLRARGS